MTSDQIMQLLADLITPMLGQGDCKAPGTSSDGFPAVPDAGAGRLAGYLALFNDPLYLLVLPYALGQPLFRRWVQRSGVYERRRELCKRVMCRYNLVMSAFSLWSAVYVLSAVTQDFPDLGVKLYGLGHFRSERYAFAIQMFYLSKYVEFLDTYFLILCGRPVIWLQFLHHCGAPLAVGLLYHWQVDGAWIFVAFNGIVHTVMYYYYACCIMKWPFPLKQHITNLQLLQFAAGLSSYYPYYELYEGDFAKCFVHRVQFSYVGMNVVLFSNFYVRTYVLKGGKGQPAKAARTSTSAPPTRGAAKSERSPTLLESKSTDAEHAKAKPVDHVFLGTPCTPITAMEHRG